MNAANPKKRRRTSLYRLNSGESFVRENSQVLYIYLQLHEDCCGSSVLNTTTKEVDTLEDNEMVYRYDKWRVILL